MRTLLVMLLLALPAATTALATETSGSVAPSGLVAEHGHGVGHGLAAGLGHGPAADLAPEPLAQANLFPTPEHDVRPQWFEQAAPSAHFAGEYNIRWVCPGQATVDDTTVQATGCPQYVLDPEDVMSQPILSVDPKDANYIAFNALHGGPGVRSELDSETPSEHSRDNVIHQPHTTFMTTDGGSRWWDYRYYAPESLSSNYDEVFGEDNAMTRDHRGNFHVGSVYAVRDGETTEYVVALYALERASQAPDYLNYVARRAQEGHTVQDISMDYVRSGKTVFAAWLEAPVGGEGSITVLHQDIDARTSTWRPQLAAERIDGCTGISNAIAVDGDVWIGCFAGEDFDPAKHIERHLEDPNETYEVPDWEVGQLQMFRIDGKDWTSHYVGPTPITNGVNAVMGSAESYRKGAMFIAGAGAQGGRSVATVTFGIYGQQWTAKLHDYAGQMTGAYIGAEGTARSVVDARITAAAFTANSGVVHMVFAERFAQTDSSQGAASEREFYKAYGAVHYTGRWLGHWDLDVGAAPAYSPVQVSGLSTDLYMDRHDSIVMHRTQSGHERIFVAYGDMGFVRFGEAVEENPPPPGWVPILPVQIIAAPIVAGNAALTAAAAGALSLSVVARMLAVKKKTTAEAPSL